MNRTMPSRISLKKQASKSFNTSTTTLNTDRCSQGAENEEMNDDVDGPQPMRNLRPVEKNPNGADNFWQTHQAEYVERAKPVGRCSRVEDHNNACPKLRDELERRHSLSKATAINLNRYHYATTQTAAYYDPKCKWCVKQKLKDDKKKQEAKKKNHDRKSRVTKSKKHQRRRMNKSLKTIKYNERFYKRLPIDKGTSPEHTKKFPTLSKMADKKLAPNVSDCSFSRRVEIKEKDSNVTRKYNSKSDVASRKYPDTSEASVTTYNSFMSVDHEPMVAD